MGCPTCNSHVPPGTRAALHRAPASGYKGAMTAPSETPRSPQDPRPPHPTGDFSDLVRRIRSGDETAAASMIRQYEPEIRREVRLRLRGSALRRIVDTMDICNSVLGRFFVSAAVGEFELKDPREVLGLLIKMTEHRVIEWSRRMKAQRRDIRRDRPLGALPDEGQGIAAPQANPSAEARAADLLEQFRSRLDDDERRIADLRSQHMPWAEIGKSLGQNPDTLRRRWDKTRERVATEIGLI